MIHHVEVQVLVLLLIASLVGMGARRLHIPYTLALVVAGLALSFPHLGALEGLALTPDLLLLLFLPPLLFEAAFHLKIQDLRRDLGPILYLAVIGVIIAVASTSILAHYGLTWLAGREFSWTNALLFASVIAATDPISVLALFKELGAPRRLYVIVEGESLINDGIALVIFSILLAVFGIGSGSHAGPTTSGQITVYAITTFLRLAAGGIMVGLVLGGLFSVLTRRIDDHLIEVTLTSVVAWGSFLIAEEIHVSGVLSTVTAGIFMGSYASKHGMSSSTQRAVEDFWEYMGFLANSFIFLLIGVELDPEALIQNASAILIGFFAVVAGRALVVYAGIPILGRFSEPMPSAWRHILVWGGLRGSLSMVLVIGLPADLPGRPFLLNLVFGIVALSLFVQGLTMGGLMRKLGVIENTPTNN
jgi:monovalent cation:H+ antiporter, CPA1 family